MADILSDISQDPDITLHFLDNYIGSAYSPQIEVTETQTGHDVAITYDDADEGITTTTFSVEDGEDGADGFSPTLSSSAITGGHRVSMTDATGTKTFDVMDGLDGADGYSPSAKVIQGDGSATITITDKDGTTTAVVHDGADGQDGRDGTDGADGFSPTATVTQTASGATISITDKSGTTTASVSNGTDGTDGTDGADGQDGFSPTVDVQPITGGHEVTITDAQGPHSFDVMDGDPAEPGSITTLQLADGAVTAAKLSQPLPVTDTIIYNAVNLTTTTNKLLNGSTGVISDAAANTYLVTDYTPVMPDSEVMISTQHFYGQGLYAFYDADKMFISGRNSEAGGERTKLYCDIVHVPANAAYVVIGLLQEASFFYCALLQGTKQGVLPSQLWSQYKWTCVGDSLTEYNIRTSAHYFDYVAGATGIEVVNMGVSGSGYANGGSNNFMTRITSVPTDSDVVTIFGSGNDISAGLQLGTASDTGTETLGGVINTTIDNLYGIMPVVNLGIVTPTPWQGNMPYNNGFMENYSNLIVEICKRRGIPCLDLFHCSNLNPNSSEVRALAYSKDNGGGTHPNELGHKLIAPRFKAFLETLLI